MPKQLNGCDCGVYVVKFVKMILDVMPRTTLVHLKDDLRSQLNKDAFTQSGVNSRSLALIDVLAKLITSSSLTSF